MHLDLEKSARTVPSFSRRSLVVPVLPSTMDSRNSATRILLVVLSVLAAMLLLAGCGSAGHATQPPVLSYSTTAAVYTKGTAITPDAPTDSGGAAAAYTVTASNAGLCGDCAHARQITSDRASSFLQCQLSFTDRRFEKYPRLPVLACSGYARQRGL